MERKKEIERRTVYEAKSQTERGFDFVEKQQKEGKKYSITDKHPHTHIHWLILRVFLVGGVQKVTSTSIYKVFDLGLSGFQPHKSFNKVRTHTVP